METVNRLSGMQDASPSEKSKRESLSRSLRDLLSLRGYQAVDTPLLEETELFLRKSGGELAAQMYSFNDPGGNRVSLRPEFTASVIRAYLANNSIDAFPYRLQYCGPVFRHRGLDDVSIQHQITQIGAELIGAASPLADVEILSLACEGLGLSKIPNTHLAIGHVGSVSGLLSGFGISDRARLFLLSSIATLKISGVDATDVIRAKATELGLLADLSVSGSDIPSDLTTEQAKAIVGSLMRDSATAPLGSRTQEEILARFLGKLRGADKPANFERALEFISRLAIASGTPSEVLQVTLDLVREYKLDANELTACRTVVELLDGRGLSSSVVLDFGLVRGIAYYTGLVFEIRSDALAGGLPLCGGGRYDSLPRDLGSARDIPALGFAWSLERMLDACDPEVEIDDIGSGEGVLVALEKESTGTTFTELNDAFTNACAVVRRLNEQGIIAETDVLSRSLSENIEQARIRGFTAVITVDGKGNEKTYKISTD